MSVLPSATAAVESNTRETIVSLIGNARCTADAECRTVAVGSRACGGPDAYLAWSVRVTDESRLREAVDRHNASQALASPPGGRLSTCVWLADPGAQCVKKGVAAASSATDRPGQCRLIHRSGSRSAPAR